MISVTIADAMVMDTSTDLRPLSAGDDSQDASTGYACFGKNISPAARGGLFGSSTSISQASVIVVATMPLVMCPAAAEHGEPRHYKEKKFWSTCQSIIEMCVLVGRTCVAGVVGILAHSTSNVMIKTSPITRSPKIKEYLFPPFFYMQKNKPSANYSAIPEVCGIAVGNNEHGGGLVVTGNVGAGGGRYVWTLLERTSVGHVKKNPSANYSAIREICVGAVGDDERGGELVVTGDVGTRATAEPVAPLFTETEHVEKSPMPNGPAVREICVLAVGDDEQGGMLAVTGVAGTSASCARGAVKQI
ncbi:hypothetical protein EDD15DRAFT_2200722 [Pisolithus albus]|nr:hypothetical protein EDD15DRAFT_2200722 [Pisolithus albus]